MCVQVKKQKQDAEIAEENPRVQKKLEKQAWEKALAKASGEKVFDNEALLKKSIKRDEQKKKKSAAAWYGTHDRTRRTHRTRTEVDACVRVLGWASTGRTGSQRRRRGKR
jgi:hypothetical protein